MTTKRKAKSMPAMQALQAGDKRKSVAGFTLVELLIVFVVISLLAIISINSFVDFNRSQTLNSATMEIVNALNTAKSRAMSQFKPTYSSNCVNEALRGYSLDIDQNDIPPTYDIYAICGASSAWWTLDSVNVGEGVLPSGVSITLSNSNDEFLFEVLTGAVRYEKTNGESITVGYKGKSHVITVFPDGRITVN